MRMPFPQKIFAREPRVVLDAGWIIGCPNGHALYRLTRDIREHEPLMASQVERLDEAAQEPKSGDAIRAQCPHCGELWWQDRGAHFIDRGWSRDIIRERTR